MFEVRVLFTVDATWKHRSFFFLQVPTYLILLKPILVWYCSDSSEPNFIQNPYFTKIIPMPVKIQRPLYIRSVSIHISIASERNLH